MVVRLFPDQFLCFYSGSVLVLLLFDKDKQRWLAFAFLVLFLWSGAALLDFFSAYPLRTAPDFNNGLFVLFERSLSGFLGFFVLRL